MNQPQQQPALFKIDGHNVHCVTAAELTALFSKQASERASDVCSYYPCLNSKSSCALILTQAKLSSAREDWQPQGNAGHQGGNNHYIPAGRPKLRYNVEAV